MVVLKERRAPELGRGRGVMEHEVELLEKVQDPNVIRCYGHFRANSATSRSGSFFMVLEYATGGDLYKQILKRRSKQKYYPEKVVLRIFQQICKGVCALHEMGDEISSRICKPTLLYGQTKSLSAFPICLPNR